MVMKLARLSISVALSALIGAGTVFGIVFGMSSCQAQAGMFCQQQSDCRVGLVCSKPAGTATPTSFGVCEPARRGSGESCLRTADCQTGLRCSIEVGVDNGDDRHGICEPQEAPQDAGPDLADLSGQDL